MTQSSETIIFAQEPEISFETVLDETCRELEDRQAKYSLRRIREFDERLQTIEKELDAFLENSDILL